MEEHVQNRITIPAVQIEVKSSIRKYFNVQSLQESRVKASGRCSFCERSKDRKTTKVCTTCIRLKCRDHLISVCPDCYASV